jgi:hypothetical protein
MTSNGERSKETVVFSGDSYVNQYISQLNRSGESTFNFELSSVTPTTVEECVKDMRETGKKCVIPTGDTTSVTATTVNHKLGFPAPSLPSIIACNNKNLASVLIGKCGWFYGFNLDQPIQHVLENVKSYPCMLKGTMLYGGALSFYCNDETTIRSSLETIKADLNVFKKKNSLFCSEAISILQANQRAELVDKCTEYIIEEYIDINVKGTYQYCMEGFISHDGRVTSYSILEELFFKNMISLGHVIPPIHFNGNFQIFESFLEWVGEKISALGFRNQAFNVEFWQLPDGSFQIVEVNPRMAAPYYDLYYQYSGNKFYQDVASFIHHGTEPEKTPLSHLKDMWSSSGQNHEHSFMIAFTTRATRKVSDIFDFDFFQDCLSNGLIGFTRLPKDDILKEAHSSTIGTTIANITLKGFWSEIVAEEKRLRKKLYKDKDQSYEYPDCYETL